MSNSAKSEAFTIGPVTLAYVDSQNSSLFSPKTNDQGKETYGCMIIFNEDVRQLLQGQIDQVGRQAFGAEWDNPHSSLKRGIHYAQEKENIAAQNRGQYYANVSSQFPPQVVDATQKPIINTIDPMTGRKPVYDGVVAYVSVNVYSFANKARGVSIGLGPVMKVGDAEPMALGGGVDVATAFANVPKFAPQGAPAPAMGQPMQPQQPPQQPAGAFPNAGYLPTQPPQQPPQAPAGFQNAGYQPQGGHNPQTGQYVPPVTN